QNLNLEFRSSPKHLIYNTPSRALIGCSREKAASTPKPSEARLRSVPRSSHATTTYLSSSSPAGSVPTPRSGSRTESTNSSRSLRRARQSRRLGGAQRFLGVQH